MNKTQIIAVRAVDYYLAVQTAKAAKKEHAAAGEKFGDCKKYDLRDCDTLRCYRTVKPLEKWCKACRGRQPFWMAERRAVYAQTAAKRKLWTAITSAAETAPALVESEAA